jgi:PKD domain
MAVLGLAAASPAGAVLTGGAVGEQRRAAPSINVAPLQYHGGPVLHSSVAYSIYWDPTGSYNSEWKQLINGYLQGVGADKGTLNNVFAMNGQYRDSSGRAANEAIYRGSYTDETPYPTTGNCAAAAAIACLTDQQIRTELLNVITSGKLPGATGTPVYYVLTPPGVTVCDGVGGCSVSTKTPPDGICGYHSAISPGGPSPTIYAVQPWVAGNAGSVIDPQEPTVTRAPTAADKACQNNRLWDEPNQPASHNIFGEWTAGLADVIINDLSVEQNNVVTNPLLNGWYQTATSAEQSDMCQFAFGADPVPLPSIPSEQEPSHAQILSNETINRHNYYLQFGFDSVGVTAGKGLSCWSGVVLDAHYTAPNPVNAGDVIGFDATESNITLNAHTQGLPPDEPYVAPLYAWNFGDGTVVTGSNTASQFHSYALGGTYTVALTVTDSSGNSNTFSQPITVVGGSSGSAPAGGTSTLTPTTPGAAGTASPGVTPAKLKPVVAAAAVSRSLRSVLRHGLVVRYSVNEQVVGRFELMLAKSTARRLGLRGAPAVGLALGTPAQIIIGKAILVTTKGGRSTVTIQLSKNTASRLGRLKHVTLMVRLIAHNASGQSVTVLGTVNLSH